jgi:hypothetical protein
LGEPDGARSTSFAVSSLPDDGGAVGFCCCGFKSLGSDCGSDLVCRISERISVNKEISSLSPEGLITRSLPSNTPQCFSCASKSTIPGMTLDKTYIARRQLGVALALFLEDLDPIVVHVLACNAGEVAERLAAKASGQPFTARALATYRNNSWRDIRRERNQFWSCFRYATTHDDDQGGYDGLMSSFNDLQNDHALLVGWYDLMSVSRKLPIEVQVFQFWYFALYPDQLGSEADVSRYEALFPRLRDLPRSDQKRALRDAIAVARQDPAIMNDPATEPGYLIHRGD